MCRDFYSEFRGHVHENGYGLEVNWSQGHGNGHGNEKSDNRGTIIILKKDLPY